MSLARVDHREQVGPYQLIKAIGAGGSARIDLARIDRAYGFQRHVVLKRPLEHLRADPDVAASLRREAQLGGRLRHPNLVSVLDAGTHDGYDYLALEYVHGASLRTVMHAEPGRVRTLPLSVALAIVIDVARGVHDAHELAAHDGTPLGLVHRDVSPGNILIGLDGTVKLSDFGIAKDTRVTTLSGSMRGTVTYMAPEQCRGHAFDRRADVFSLGVILHELITGRRLFWADNDVASLHRVLSGDVPNPRDLDPTIAPDLAAIVMAAVAHDTVRRTPTTRQLADDLEAFAARAAIVIGARSIARAIKSVVGDRPAPWVTVQLPASSFGDHEPSLVDVIARAPEVDEPVLPTFGPTDDHSDELATPVRRPTVIGSPRGSKRLALFVVLGIAAGAGATVAVMSTLREPSTTGAAAPDPTPPPPAPPTGSVVDSFDPLVVTPVDPTTPPARERPKKSSSPTSKSRPTTTSKSTPPTTSKSEPRSPATGSATTSPTGSPPTAGSSSPPPRVEWKPTLLLPTDSGSGSAAKP